MVGSSSKEKERNNFLSFEERIQQYNDQMRSYEIQSHPVPENLLEEFQEIYNKGIIEGKTFVRNTNPPYIYFEDFTVLANAIHLHDILFDPNALGRVPLDQPLISFIGGGSRKTIGLKDKVLLLKSPVDQKDKFIIIKGESFGGKRHWWTSLKFNKPDNRRNITQIIFMGIIEVVSDNKKISLIRSMNGLNDSKYNSLKFFKLKYSLTDVEKVIKAKLHEIYTTRTFSRRVRHPVISRIRNIQFKYTTRGILHTKFSVYQVNMNLVIKKILILNTSDLIDLNPEKLAKQIIEQILIESIPLKVSRTGKNSIHLFKDINNSTLMTNDEKYILIANDTDKTRAGHFKSWFESCPQAWMNAVTRFIFQDLNFRNSLELKLHKNITSVYTGQARIIKENEPSGFPDIVTVTDKKKVIDIIQVKELGYKKPFFIVDLFRDITKTAGWFNSKGIDSALNSFVIQSSSIVRLNYMKKFGSENVVIIGKWNKIKDLNRFGEVVEIIRILKMKNKTNTVQFLDLSNLIENSDEILIRLKTEWKLAKSLLLKGLSQVSTKLLNDMIDYSNRYSDPKQFYVAMLQLLGINILLQEKKNGPGRI